jgi:hypothetical protein
MDTAMLEAADRGAGARAIRSDFRSTSSTNIRSRIQPTSRIRKKAGTSMTSPTN